MIYLLCLPDCFHMHPLCVVSVWSAQVPHDLKGYWHTFHYSSAHHPHLLVAGTSQGVQQASNQVTAVKPPACLQRSSVVPESPEIFWASDNVIKLLPLLLSVALHFMHDLLVDVLAGFLFPLCVTKCPIISHFSHATELSYTHDRQGNDVVVLPPPFFSSYPPPVSIPA